MADKSMNTDAGDTDDLLLIERVLGSKRDTPDGHVAFDAIVTRFHRPLRSHLLFTYGRFIHGNDGVLEELVNETFVCFWRYALPKFDTSKIDATTNVRVLILAWLKKSAKFAFQSAYSSRKKLYTLMKLGFCDEEGPRPLNSSSETECGIEDRHLTKREHLMRRARDALSSIADRDRQILLAFYNYYDETCGECRLDSAAQTSICDQFDFPTWDAARKARQRAAERLNQAYSAMRKDEVA